MKKKINQIKKKHKKRIDILVESMSYFGIFFSSKTKIG